MLLSISVMLILLVTSVVAYFTNIKRKYLNTMTGMIVSMTNASMTSIAYGTIIGILLQERDLTLPTMISVSIGMIVGYSTGRPVSLIAALDGVIAGIMGGMMGAMLGIMLPPNDIPMMIFFTDVIYLFVAVLLIRVMNQETKTKTNRKTFIY